MPLILHTSGLRLLTRSPTSPNERKIYMRNKVDFEYLEERQEVQPWAKYLGWLFLVLYNCGIGFYVCLFG